MSIEEMQTKVKELRELRIMAEELNDEITAIQDSIKCQMTEAGVDELVGVDYKITWKEVTSSKLDTAALKKALPEVVSQFTKETTCKRFNVA